MKKILIFSILTVGLLCGCADMKQDSWNSEGEGVIRFAVSLPEATRAAEDDYDVLAHSTLRIYKVETANDGTAERLVRKYSPVSELPSEVYLAAGNYKVTVAAGDGSMASFSHKSYYGENSFTLKPNAVTETSVVCKVQNIAVEVVFDDTVTETFDIDRKVYVNAADTFSLEDAERKLVPSLTYESDAMGYFLLPEGTKNITWGFYGQSSDPDLAAKSTKTGIIELPSGGMHYTLKFKYTHDAEGELTVSIRMREYEEIIEDRFNFSPQPVISGKGFDIASETAAYNTEPIEFSIDAINALTNITMSSNGKTYQILSDGQPDDTNSGITCSVSDGVKCTITLGKEFFEEQPAGIHNYTFTVEDSGNAEVHATARIAVPGPIGIVSSDLWFGRLVLGAVVTSENPDNLTLSYRRTDTKDSDSWHDAGTLSATSEKYIYTLSGIGFDADATYEFKLLDSNTEIGKTVIQDSERGVQLPNAGFEEWHKSGNIWYPYGEGQEEFWGTGNPGSASLGPNYNVALSSTDHRPGSTGSLSAVLETKNVVVKLAAGNLMVGSFGKIMGTKGGTVNMGRPFDFNARPKALKVWYKYKQVKQDKGRIYLCLVNMTNGDTCHVVDTTNAEATTFSPNDEYLYTDKTDESTLQGHIIGYCDKLIEETVSEWTELTLPITYRDTFANEKPNVLILTAASSYRGDYFEGEIGSTLYIDDIEFVY